MKSIRTCVVEYLGHTVVETHKVVRSILNGGYAFDHPSIGA
jgi:hypothetical protein